MNGSAPVTPEARRALVDAILKRHGIGKPKKAKRVEPELIRRESTGAVLRIR